MAAQSKPSDESSHRSITLSWLFAQASLELRQVVASSSAEVEFSYIQPTELPDPTPFLLPGSVVLTVGLAFESKPRQLENYVASLKQSGVVAIGFGTGLSFAAVPEALSLACQQHELTLFEVPHKIPFISIINAVNQEFSRQESRNQERLMRAQRRLNQSAITEGIVGLLSATSQLIDAHLAIYDNDQRLVAQSGTVAPAAGKKVVVKHKMLTFGDRYHQLITASTKRTTALDRAIIKHTMGLAELLLQRPSQLRKARSDLNALALTLLLGIDGNPDHLSRVFARISDNSGNVRPVLIHSNVAVQIDRACAAVDAALMLTDRELCSLRLDETLALLLFRGTRSIDNILDLFGTTRTKLRICLDVPQHWSQINNQLIKQLTVSVKSLKLGENSSPRSNTVRWLQAPEVIAALDQRAQETIDKLILFDAANNTELRTTLAVYLQQGASISLTAETLGIHRHTVRTRIGKIASICEVDLDDPVTRAELLLVVITRETNHK